MEIAPHLEDLGYCPFAMATGKPCVLCGGTRAALALVRGDFYEAYKFNISVVVLLSMFLLVAIRRIYYVYVSRNIKLIHPGQLIGDLGDAIRNNYRLTLFLGILWWLWNIKRW
jgi:Protein of unknown function (DUF2752)